MRKRYYLLPLLILLFIACESSEDADTAPAEQTTPEPEAEEPEEEAEAEAEEPEPEITIPTEYSSIELDSDALTQIITFTATADWAITLSETTRTAPDWMTVSPMSGSAGSATITITTDENSSSESRSASITITSDGVEQTISVTQEAFEPTNSAQLEDLDQEEL